jgi:isomaltose glucohydrolase
VTSTPPVTGRLSTADLRARSIELVRRHQHPSGAYPAAPGFSAYDGYAWFRDGSFVAEGMSRAGAHDSAEAWHRWVADLLAVEADRVADLRSRRDAGLGIRDEDMLPTRYRLDGSRGADAWWDVQIDGLGTWLWSLHAHEQRSGRGLDWADDAVRTATDYLCTFAADPSYDWWEEFRDHTHVASLAPVRHGLLRAAASGRLGEERLSRVRTVVARIEELVTARGTTRAEGPTRLAKWLDGDGLDASLLAAVHPFGLAGPSTSVGRATVCAVRDTLCRDGGVHRYLDDTFYGGGRWPLLTAFLGWAEAACGDTEAASTRLRWVLSQADDDGLLPEQVGDPLLHPHRHEEWVQRWGPVARPLLWSHGMFLVLDDVLHGSGLQDLPAPVRGAGA